MELYDLLLCGISVLQSPHILCEPGNKLNQTFPAIKLHINKFNPTGTNTLQFPIRYFKFTRFLYRLRILEHNANQQTNDDKSCFVLVSHEVASDVTPIQLVGLRKLKI